MKKNIWLVVMILALTVFFGNDLWAKGNLELELVGGKWSMKPVFEIIDGDTKNWQASGEGNIGIALRLKPGNSFSVGLGWQGIRGQYSAKWTSQDFGNYKEEREDVIISGNMGIIDFRWEIAPRWRIRPYFNLGVGVMILKFTDTYYSNGEPKEEEGDFPSVLPVLELMFGLKAELIKKKLSVGIEGGFLDGLVVRGTLNFRF